VRNIDFNRNRDLWPFELNIGKFVTLARSRPTCPIRFLRLFICEWRVRLRQRNWQRKELVDSSIIVILLDNKNKARYFLADRNLVTVELLSWLSSVCPSICLSFACHGCTVAKRCKIGLAIVRIGYSNSVRLSVRPSVTSRYRLEATWHRDLGFLPNDSLTFLVIL